MLLSISYGIKRVIVRVDFHGFVSAVFFVLEDFHKPIIMFGRPR